MTIELMFRDSNTIHRYEDIKSFHEEGRYSSLYLNDGVILKWPTDLIFRVRIG